MQPTNASTGYPLLDQILQVAGAIYVVGSMLSAMLPKDSLAAQLISRFTADLKGVLQPEDKIRAKVEAETRASGQDLAPDVKVAE